MSLKYNYKKLSLFCLGLGLAASSISVTVANAAVNKSHSALPASKLHANKKNKKSIIKAQYLFVQQAGYAVVDRDGSNLNIILNKIRSPMMYFSDAPVRRAGRIDVYDFVKAWDNQKDHPINLVLEGRDYKSDREYRLAVTMTNIIITNKGRGAVLNVKPITSLAGIKLPLILDNANTFIDGLPCGMEC